MLRNVVNKARVGLARRTPMASQSRALSSAYNPQRYEEDDRPIDIKWWTGKPAIPFEKFQIDTSKYDLDKILTLRDANGDVLADADSKEGKDLKDHMQHIFDEVGAVNLKNTGLKDDINSMSALVNLLFPHSMDYEGGANPREYKEKNVYDTGAPKSADIMYHHEMAYVEQSTKWLAFCAIHATKDPYKGATFIAENNGTHDDLMNTELGQKLKDKGVCYVRKLPDQKHFIDNKLDPSIVYNFWQTSFGTEDMDEAAEHARRVGLDVEWEDSPIFGRYMVTKFNVSCFEYDPYSDRNALYCSIADDYSWFQTWPGVKDLPHWERPLKLNFADGEVMTRAEKETFSDSYDKNGTPILWEQGDIAICCNHRTAHGRPRFSLEEGEKRELGVILGDTYERVGDKEGKWN